MAQRDTFSSHKLRRERLDASIPLNDLDLIERLARVAAGWAIDDNGLEQASSKTAEARENDTSRRVGFVRSFWQLRFHV